MIHRNNTLPLKRWLVLLLTAGLLLAGCANPLGDDAKAELREPDRGLVTIQVDAGEARTLLPNPTFTAYRLYYAPKDDSEDRTSIPPGTEGSAQVSLLPGEWIISAEGLVSIPGSAEPKVGASGSVTIEVEADSAVNVKIPISSKTAGDPGVFSYNPGFLKNEGLERAELTLTLLEATEAAKTVNLLSDAGADNPGFVELPPGYYLLKISAEQKVNGEGLRLGGIVDVVHIYANLETRAGYTAADLRFSDAVLLGGTLTTRFPVGFNPDTASIFLYSNDSRTAQYLLESVEITSPENGANTWGMVIPADMETLYPRIEVEAGDGAKYSKTVESIAIPSGGKRDQALGIFLGSVTVDPEITNGNIMVNESAGPIIAVEGASISLTLEPDEGYMAGTLEVMNGDTAVDVNGEGLSFIMPAGDITVSAAFREIILESIAITTPPTKTVYAKGETLDITGMVVTGTYTDTTTKAETVTTVNVSGYDKDTLGEQTLTVTVNGKTATFTVTVSAAELVSIAVTTPPEKESYAKGEALDITGLVVTGTYSDTTTKAETITATDVSGFNPLPDSTPVTQTLTVTVNGKTATFTVTVNAAALVSIAITTPPTKTVYAKGEDLDLNGMVVTGTYTDTTTKAETITDVSGYNKETLGEQTLTVTVNGKTTAFTVTVKLSMNMTVEFTELQDETIGISQDTSVVKGTAISITVTPTFDSYQWYLDGNIVADAAGNSLEIPTANLTLGSHNVTVLVEKGTTPYTKLLHFQVTR
jgi:hypothetical protein